MFYGALEIETIENGIATFKNGEKIDFPECNKYLLTEEPIKPSVLSDKQVEDTSRVWFPIISDMTKDKQDIIREIITDGLARDISLDDISKTFASMVARINDISQSLGMTIGDKNDQMIVKMIGEEKLNTRSKIYGSDTSVPAIQRMQVSIKDIFNL